MTVLSEEDSLNENGKQLTVLYTQGMDLRIVRSRKPNVAQHLAPRIHVPTTGCWDRVVGAGQKEQLDVAAKSLQSGGVIAIVGPAASGKSAYALAVADRIKRSAVYYHHDLSRPVETARSQSVLIMDPVSYWGRDSAVAALRAYGGAHPLILVDRTARIVQPFLPEGAPLIQLELPAESDIAHIIKKGISRAPHTLHEHDIAEIATSMNAMGMNANHVNQAVLDASLLRLQYGQSIDRDAFEVAITAMDGVMKR